MARDVAALARLGRQVAEQQGFPTDDPTIDYTKYGQEASYRIGKGQSVPTPEKFRIGHQQPRVPGHVQPRRAARVAGPADLELEQPERHTVKIGAFEIGYHNLPRAAHRPQHKTRNSERTTGNFRMVRRRRRPDNADTRAKARGVPFADPGYRPDRKPRYRLDTAKRVRAAWAYINRRAYTTARGTRVPANASYYTREQLRLIHSRIQAAGRRFGVEFGHARTRRWR